MSDLTGPQLHRAAGVLLASACGDALGAAYEFGPPLPDDAEVAMVGGGFFGWEPGESTDDTSMAFVIAEVAATGADLRDQEAQDEIAAGWWRWMHEAKDVGSQTRQVLNAGAAASDTGVPTAATLRKAAEDYHESKKLSAGNGSLMRTAPVALAYLDDPHALVGAAGAISALTHFDPEAGEACALWCLAIRHAVLHGELDIRVGLAYLPKERSVVWETRIAEAEDSQPRDFTNNYWSVQAFQAAWSAIHQTAIPAEDPSSESFVAQHLSRSLETAVRGGEDTDTVAAIAGGLLGARYGASAIPAQWRRILHGWPGKRARDLISAAVMIACGGQPDSAGWPTIPKMDYAGYGDIDQIARHPRDPGVILAGIGHLDPLPEGVDAVVSLCRLGHDQVPAAGIAPQDHVEVWLVDSSDPQDNPNLDFVLSDTANVVERLRDEGRTVLLHCVQAQSRTPTVAAMYSMRRNAVDSETAFAAVQGALPDANPNPGLRGALSRTLAR